MEWDLENAERLKYSRYGEADRIITRGHGHDVSQRGERLLRSARGFPEGVIEAWGNLYNEFAVAVACRLDDRSLPAEWIQLPGVVDGARGVRFIEAVVESSRESGAWTDCRLSLDQVVNCFTRCR